MMPDEWLPDETREWITRGMKDLRVAGICANELPAEALFHCPQAAEKFLKAFLTWHRTVFRKTHELRELAMMCVRIDATLEAPLSPLSPFLSMPGGSVIPARPTNPTPARPREAGNWPIRCGWKSERDCHPT